MPQPPMGQPTPFAKQQTDSAGTRPTPSSSINASGPLNTSSLPASDCPNSHHRALRVLEERLASATATYRHQSSYPSNSYHDTAGAGANGSRKVLLPPGLTGFSPASVLPFYPSTRVSDINNTPSRRAGKQPMTTPAISSAFLDAATWQKVWNTETLGTMRNGDAQNAWPQSGFQGPRLTTTSSPMEPPFVGFHHVPRSVTPTGPRNPHTSSGDLSSARLSFPAHPNSHAEIAQATMASHSNFGCASSHSGSATRWPPRNTPRGPRNSPPVQDDFPRTEAYYNRNCHAKNCKQHNPLRAPAFKNTSPDCPTERHDTKLFEAQRNAALKRFNPDIPKTNLGLDWLRMGLLLQSQGACEFSIEIWNSLHRLLHPPATKLHTINNVLDEHHDSYKNKRGGYHRQANTKPDVNAATRLLALLDKVPKDPAGKTATVGQNEYYLFWESRYRRFWYVILYASTQLPVGDPRQEKLGRIMNSLYTQCQQDVPPESPRSYTHVHDCIGNCFETKVPCQPGYAQKPFKAERYLWLWERLAESWNAYEYFAPRFEKTYWKREPYQSSSVDDNVPTRNSNNNSPKSRQSPKILIRALECSCIIGDDFDPFVPRGKLTVDEWVRINALLARFVKLRGECEPFIHKEGKGDRAYNVLWMKGLYCMIEAFEASYGPEQGSTASYVFEKEACLAALGAASQWILLGRLTPTWLDKNSVHFRAEFNSSRRLDIRHGRRQYAFGDLYPVSRSIDFQERFKFWMNRLDSILSVDWSWAESHPHILVMAKNTQRRADEDCVEDETRETLAGNLPLQPRIRAKVYSRLHNREYREQSDRKDQRAMSQEEQCLNIKGHVVKTEITDCRLYLGRHERVPIQWS